MTVRRIQQPQASSLTAPFDAGNRQVDALALPADHVPDWPVVHDAIEGGPDVDDVNEGFGRDKWALDVPRKNISRVCVAGRVGRQRGDRHGQPPGSGCIVARTVGTASRSSVWAS